MWPLSHVLKEKLEGVRKTNRRRAFLVESGMEEPKGNRGVWRVGDRARKWGMWECVSQELLAGGWVRWRICGVFTCAPSPVFSFFSLFSWRISFSVSPLPVFSTICTCLVHFPFVQPLLNPVKFGCYSCNCGYCALLMEPNPKIFSRIFLDFSLTLKNCWLSSSLLFCGFWDSSFISWGLLRPGRSRFCRGEETEIQS